MDPGKDWLVVITTTCPHTSEFFLFLTVWALVVVVLMWWLVCPCGRT